MNKIIILSLLLVVGMTAKSQIIYSNKWYPTINYLIDSLEKKIDSLTKVIQSFHQLEGRYPPIYERTDSTLFSEEIHISGCWEIDKPIIITPANVFQCELPFITARKEDWLPGSGLPHKKKKKHHKPA